MSENHEPLEAITIAPGTLLWAVVGKTTSGSRRNQTLYDMLFGQDGSLFYGAVQRMWNDRVGGLILYALGVRSFREMERVRRERARRGH